MKQTTEATVPFAGAQLRAALFGVWVLVLFTGPLLKLFDVPARPSWNMYRGYSTGLCVMRVYEHDDQGTAREVERLDLLGYEGRHHAVPERLRHAVNLESADTIIKQMCAGRSAPLFVEVKCGRAGKWHRQRSADVDACGAAR